MPYNPDGHVDGLFGKGMKANSTSLQRRMATGFQEVRLQDGLLQAGSLQVQQVPGDTGVTVRVLTL